MTPPVTRRAALAAGTAALLAPTLAHTQPATQAAGPSIQGAGFYRFALGELECIVVTDGGATFDWTTLFARTPPADVRAAADAAFVDPTRAPGAIHALVVRQPGRPTMVVDAGRGADAATSKLPVSLRNAGVALEEIELAFVTHLHGDHYGGVLKLPNVRTIVLAETERAGWQDGTPFGRGFTPPAMQEALTKGARAFLDAARDRLKLVADGDEIAPGAKVVALPGHTPGMCGLLLSSGDAALLHVADAINALPVQIRHPDQSSAFDADPARAAESRAAALAMARDKPIWVTGSHLPFPALGHVVSRGNGREGLEWVPVAWAY